MKRFSHQLRIQDARAINANFAAATAGRQEVQEPTPAVHVAAGGDANRLARAVRKMCLQRYGCFMQGGAKVLADGSPVLPGSVVDGRVLSEFADLSSHQDSGDTSGAISQQQINNPNRLMEAVRRHLAATGRMESR